MEQKIRVSGNRASLSIQHKFYVPKESTGFKGTPSLKRRVTLQTRLYHRHAASPSPTWLPFDLQSAQTYVWGKCCGARPACTMRGACDIGGSLSVPASVNQGSQAPGTLAYLRQSSPQAFPSLLTSPKLSLPPECLLSAEPTG